MVEPTPNWDNSNTIESQWSHYVIFGCSVFALGWGAINALKVSIHATPRRMIWRV
jgi:hypothetical protein